MTQGVQDGNEVPLVAHRRTAVRASIVNVQNDGPPQDVVGRLHVSVDGTTITPQLPRTASGRGLLRVYANDGMSTSSAEIRGLSVSRPGWVLERPADPR